MNSRDFSKVHFYLIRNKFELCYVIGCWLMKFRIKISKMSWMDERKQKNIFIRGSEQRQYLLTSLVKPVNNLYTLKFSSFWLDRLLYCIAINCVLYFVNNTCIKAIILKFWRSESIFVISFSQLWLWLLTQNKIYPWQTALRGIAGKCNHNTCRLKIVFFLHKILPPCLFCNTKNELVKML